MGYLSLRDSTKGTWREGSLLGTLKDALIKVLEMGVCFYRGANFGEQGGALFS